MAKEFFAKGCRREVKARAGESLFERDWEVLVIKRDPASGEYSTTTLCCESSRELEALAVLCC